METTNFNQLIQAIINRLEQTKNSESHLCDRAIHVTEIAKDLDRIGEDSIDFFYKEQKTNPEINHS